MLFAYIGAGVVAALLIVFTAMSITWLSKRVGDSILQKTSSLISTYNDLLDKKSEELTALDRQLEEKQAEVEKLLRDGENVPKAVQNSTSSALNAVERVSTTAYRDQNVGQTYQQIRETFSFDTGDLFNALLEAQKTIKKGPATKLLEAIDFKTVYQLSTISSDDQLEVLSQGLSDEGLELLGEYMEKREDFGALEFYEWLKIKATEEPQAIKIYLPSGSTVKVPEGVEVVVDDTICEGFQVEIDRTIYDYCIKANEVF